MLKPRREIVLVLLLAGSAGCATAPHRACTPAVVGGGRGVIFVADGAGGFGATSDTFRKAVDEQMLPLQVVTVDWSHGSGRIVADQVDWCHSVIEGRRLAGQVGMLRQQWPGGEIYLVGFSAGCGVILQAAEALPGDCVDRVLLLSPSVSADYDLRPALRASRQGIDVFYSERDLWQLGIGISIVGTADRCWRAAAGRVGFRPVVGTPADAHLYAARLRQHPWDPSVAWTGNYGRHYDSYHKPFLKAYVLPLLASP
jgi:pimeloyl-ACP methyl ester carboxylesterase